MKVLFSLMACLAIAVCGYSQGDGPCYDSFCYCVSDVGCQSSGCTFYPPANCTSGTFTVPCSSSNYHFVTKVICSNPDQPCTSCESCAYIYPTTDRNNIIARCHTTRCDLGDCVYACEASLTAGINYTLAVCLIPCPGSNSTCHDCLESCTAYGCVYINVTTECVPL